MSESQLFLCLFDGKELVDTPTLVDPAVFGGKVHPVERQAILPCTHAAKSFSLFMRRKFCGGIPVRKKLSQLTFSPYKAANPAFPWPGPNVSPHSLGGRLAQPCPLHSVRHGLLDRPDRVQEHTVLYSAVFSLDGGLLCVDESLLLQPVHVLPHRVGAHPRALADSLKAGPALIRLPVLAEQEVGVHGDFPLVKPQRKDFVGEGEIPFLHVTPRKCPPRFQLSGLV